MGDTKRKICITTWYGTENYGSNLQAIGLSRTLSRMGYTVFFLKRFSVKKYIIKHPVMLFARIEKKLNKKRRKEFFSPEDYEISEVRKQKLNKFKDYFFKELDITDDQEWEQLIKDKTIFVAGSDIIWNPVRGYPSTPFLDFAYYAGLDRFSYASSVGATSLPAKYYRAYKRYLGSMKAVSVREQTVADMLTPIIKKNVTQVVDPTLLLSAKEWESFSQNADLSVNISKDGYVLCYFVMNDERYWDYVSKIKQQTGLQIIVLPMHKKDELQPYTIVLDGTPYEFTWLIKNAEFVCTDSFHACVISMIFEKEFYLLRRTRKSEDAKYNDFLDKYGLLDRAVTDESTFIRNKNMNYTIAKKELQKDKKRSLEFLIETLEACND